MKTITINITEDKEKDGLFLELVKGGEGDMTTFEVLSYLEAAKFSLMKEKMA